MIHKLWLWWHTCKAETVYSVMYCKCGRVVLRRTSKLRARR